MYCCKCWLFDRMYVWSRLADEASPWISTFFSQPVWFSDTCHSGIVGTSWQAWHSISKAKVATDLMQWSTKKINCVCKNNANVDMSCCIVSDEWEIVCFQISAFGCQSWHCCLTCSVCFLLFLWMNIFGACLLDCVVCSKFISHTASSEGWLLLLCCIVVFVLLLLGDYNLLWCAAACRLL